MQRPYRILLLASYELGHQPLSLAWPLAFLRRAGFHTDALDLSVQSLTETDIARADFIGLASPMHTALRLATLTARRVRTANPRAHVCFYGLYAQLNAALLFEQGLADSVIAGEVEAPLVELVRALTVDGDASGVPGVSTAALMETPALARLSFPTPERSSLPALMHYARYINGDGSQLTGYVEASRGCLHTCRHCPITPVYAGRFFIVPIEVVLADIAQQVEAGASEACAGEGATVVAARSASEPRNISCDPFRTLSPRRGAGAQHITFGDPDFLNGPKHALAIARDLHARWPTLTFDFTTKVEHILQHRSLFADFAQLGCTFVVSAIESVSDRVLAMLHKGHTAAEIDTALAILDSAGIALQPTLVAFAPWTTLEDYIAQVEWIRERGLITHIPPVQLSIRLLLPPGSPLVHVSGSGEWLRELDAENFTYRWQHPDPRMDALYERVTARVAEAERCGEDSAATFESIRALAYAAAGQPAPAWEPVPIRARPPRLTENWFC